jgi:hypothetical protein
MNSVASTALPRSSDIWLLAEALRDRDGVLARLAAAASKNEQAVASLRAVQRELVAAQERHDREIARERGEHAVALAVEREQWAQELASQRRLIEQDMQEIAKLKERAEKDGKAAAALRKDWQERFAKLQELAA